MRFTAFLSSAFFAAAVFAAPRSENGLKKRANLISDGQAGAVIKPDSGKSFNYVGGIVKAPGLSGNSASAVSAWIGIDGLDDSGNTDAHVVQTGIDIEMASNGKVSYKAWYEWYPNPLTYFDSDISIAKDDEIVMSLTITGSGTTATAALKNIQSNKEVSKEFYSPGEEYDSTGTDAEWVIEQPPGAAALANFGTLQFTECEASDSSKKSYDVSGAQGITLKKGSNTLAVGSVDGSSTVKIEYQT